MSEERSLGSSGLKRESEAVLSASRLSLQVENRRWRVAPAGKTKEITYNINNVTLLTGSYKASTSPREMVGDGLTGSRPLKVLHGASALSKSTHFIEWGHLMLNHIACDNKQYVKEEVNGWG